MKGIAFLFFLFTVYGTHTQCAERWYKIVYTSNGAWNEEADIFIIGNDDNDSFQVRGYTDYGATVSGVIHSDSIIIPKQILTQTLHGRAGSSVTFTVEATGRITDSILVLQFYFEEHGYGHVAGKIKATKWSNKIGVMREQSLRAADSLYHTGNTRDTVIDGIKYGWIVYDTNHQMIEIGQQYDNRIKNGRWLYTNDEGRLDNIHHYVNDVLHGWTISYSYKEYYLEKRLFCLRFRYKIRRILRSRGMYVNGIQTGKWTHDWATLRKGRNHKWETEVYYIYDSEGNMMSKTFTYNDGKPSLAIFYSKDGATIWHCNYDRKGNIVTEGKEAEVVELGW